MSQQKYSFYTFKKNSLSIKGSFKDVLFMKFLSIFFVVLREKEKYSCYMTTYLIKLENYKFPSYINLIALPKISTELACALDI